MNLDGLKKEDIAAMQKVLHKLKGMTGIPLTEVLQIVEENLRLRQLAKDHADELTKLENDNKNAMIVVFRENDYPVFSDKFVLDLELKTENPQLREKFLDIEDRLERKIRNIESLRRDVVNDQKVAGDKMSQMWMSIQAEHGVIEPKKEALRKSIDEFNAHIEQQNKKRWFTKFDTFPNIV